MLQSESVNELFGALAKAQANLKPAHFNKTNPHFKSKYADMTAVLEAVRRPLAEHGLAVTQTTEVRDGALVLVTRMGHSSGQWIAGEYPLPNTGRPHEIGSAMTYAKRYSLSAIVGISADDDDDGNAAQSAPAHPTRINPHVTRPEDVTDAKPRFNANGNRIDWIDTSEHRVERMPKAKARPVAALLNSTMLLAENEADLVEWGIQHAEQVAGLPEDWETIIQGRYQEHLDALRAKQKAA